MQMYNYYNQDIVKNRGYTMAGYEQSYTTNVKSEGMDVDPLVLNKYDYNRHESPCSPTSSSTSGQSGHDLQTLTPPATPYTNTTTLRPLTPNKRNMSPLIHGNMPRDAGYYGRSINDEAMGYYHRTDAYAMSPGMSTTSSLGSGRDIKYNSKSDSYGCVSYAHQLHPHSAYSLASSPAPSNTAGLQYNPHGQNLVNNNNNSNTNNNNFTATPLDTDVDPKELDQYLHNQPQIRRVSSATAYSSFKTEEVLELQPMPTTGDPETHSTSDKYDLNGQQSGDSINSVYYHENPYQYQYPHAPWGSYSN